LMSLLRTDLKTAWQRSMKFSATDTAELKVLTEQKDRIRKD
jgi:hypothetical protein